MDQGNERGNAIGLGDRVTIDGIEMTCTEIRIGFGYTRYHLIYFNGGELRELEFVGGELMAMGAEVAQTQTPFLFARRRLELEAQREEGGM